MYVATDFPDHIDVVFELPRNTRSKDCAVTMTSRDVVAGVRGQPPVVSGRLWANVSPNESTWTLDSVSGALTLHFEKELAGSHWPLLISEPRVKGDLDSMDPNSAYLLAMKMQLEELAQSTEAKLVLALLKSAAARKHVVAARRLFDIYYGDDVLFGAAKKDVALLLPLADAGLIDAVRIEKLGAAARRRCVSLSVSFGIVCLSTHLALFAAGQQRRC